MRISDWSSDVCSSDLHPRSRQWLCGVYDLMSGILSIGAYVPLMRLQRAAVYEANKWFAPGLRGLARGERAIANWDEDVVTMAVEAARDCLVGPDAAGVSTPLLGDGRRSGWGRRGKDG